MSAASIRRDGTSNEMLTRMRMILRTSLFVSFACIAGLQSALGECTSIPGADQIWTTSHLRWVLIGEIHGSNETPEAFADLVCDALAHGRRVTVALERPSAEQTALDRMLTSDDLGAAKDELLRQPGWREGGQDGRASEAMLRLLLKLRTLHATHPSLGVYAFDVPASTRLPGARDEAMGKALLTLGEKRPSDLILVLTGNAHTFEAAQFGYAPMATFLPRNDKLSLEVTNNGGEFWTLMMNGACGAGENGAAAKGGNRPRGIELKPKLAPYGKVDGIFSLGEPATASTPAVEEVSRLPACRKKFLELHPGG